MKRKKKVTVRLGEGGVRLATRTKHQTAAVTAILGVGDLFGELCLIRQCKKLHWSHLFKIAHRRLHH
jgi:hypothetical protein